MKKITFILLLTLNYVFADVNAVVSILPQEAILKQIGAEKVNVDLMVKPGNSPHTYEPKPNQMIHLSDADIYFSIGVEFEKTWLPRFKNQNKNMRIVNVAESIKKIEIQSHHHHDEDKEHHEEEHETHDEHEAHSKDPHVWLSPSNMKIIAQNFYEALASLDAKNSLFYKKNLEKFILHVKNTDEQIKEILKDTPKDSKFMVFHPSWGYFAHEYNLIQIPIELEGKSPKPKDLKHLIHEAKEENIKAIFTSPEFSDASAKVLAKELNIPIIKISPLAPNWSENLITFAKAIANKR